VEALEDEADRPPVPGLLAARESGTSMAPITWRRVDFPEPDGPAMATTDPAAMSSVTSSIAVIDRPCPTS